MIPNIRSWKLIGNWRKVFFILPTIPNIDRRISLFEQRTSQEFVYSSSNFHPRFFFRLRFEDARARQVHESTKCTFMQSNCSSKQKIVAFIRQRLQEVWRARKSRKKKRDYNWEIGVKNIELLLQLLCVVWLSGGNGKCHFACMA